MAGTDRAQPRAGTSRQVRRRAERHGQERQQQARGRRGWVIGGGIAVAVVALAGGGAYALHGGAPSGVQAGGVIDGIQCAAAEGQAEHIHVHLALFRDGAPVTLPAQVGIPVNQAINQPQNYCLYWLHTHATTNVVHIEAPVAGTYTLGQFIDIWRQTARWDAASTITGAPIVDASVTDALRAATPAQIHVYVGRTEVGANYRAVTFINHEDITVEVGHPTRPPVTTFNWTAWEKTGL